MYIAVVTAESGVSGGKNMNINVNIAPAVNSTNGYCQEMLLWSFRY
jgi:hypothetical protein